MASCTTKAPTSYEILTNVTNTNGGVYYEIFVRSFADSNGDGEGDLKGIEAKLPYLKTLGVKGLWLTPINPSPSYHGYDVTDYKAVHPDFGTLSDFDDLVVAAREQNIDIILDLVMNHSSVAHEWHMTGRTRFRDGNFDANDPNDKANWYDYYWDNGTVKTHGFFGDSMPEFSLDNTAVRAEFQSIAAFWLERGVKGFRLDATSHFYAKDVDNITFLEWFSDEVKSIRNDAYIVAEAWIPFQRQVGYYGGVDSLFNFSAADVGGYIIDRITSRIGTTIAHSMAQNYTDMYAVNEDAIMALFLTNHDMDRSSQMFLNDYDERQRVAASIYLLSPGHPFMYYGEEIGLKGSRHINQTDANRRLPMIWQKNDDDMRTNYPPLTDYDGTKQVKDGVLEHLEDPFSLLNHYRKVISVRNSYDWLTHALVENYGLRNNGLTSIVLRDRDDSDQFVHVIHNILREPQTVDLSNLIPLYDVKIAHDIFATKERAVLKGGVLTLAPYSSVILERK